MRFRFRTSAYTVACSLLALIAAIGCSGKEESPSVASSSSASSTTVPTAPPTTQPSSNDSSGESSADYVAPEETSAMSGSEMGMGINGSMSDMESPASMYSGAESMPDMGYGSMGYGSMGSGSMDSGSMGMGGLMGMGGMMGMGAQSQVVDPAPGEDADYMTKAKYAFAIGKEAAAEQYFIAQLLANEEESASLLSQVRWSAGARRPTTTLRFAVGVDLKAPANVTDVRPIGSSVPNNTNGGGASDMGMSSFGSMGNNGSGKGPGAQKTFGELTGKFGEELMKSFESAWDNGDFSTVFKDVDTIEPLNRAAGINGMNSMGSSAMGSMPNMSGMMPNEGSEMGSEMGMAPGGIPGTAGPDPTPRMKAVPGKVVVPGLLYLGTGSLTELTEKCQSENIDYLFFFEVNVKAQRQRIQNDTRLRLIAAKFAGSKEGNLGATNGLMNLEVDREIAMKGESEDLTKSLANLFRKVEPLKLTDMPKLQPVHAQARIKSLIEKNSKDVLPTLLEIRLFHSMGLLDDIERDAAYQLALGGNGLALVSGTAEDRAFVLDPLLPAYK